MGGAPVKSYIKWKTLIGLKDHRNTVNAYNPIPVTHDMTDLNANGHRGPDFKQGVEFLAVGCSVTHGIGLSHEDTWPHKLAQLMGVGTSYNVMGYPGKSLAFMLRQIIEYFNEVGLPKRIFILAPDIMRPDYFGFDENIIFLKSSNQPYVEKKLKSLDFEYILDDVPEVPESDDYVKNIPYLEYIYSASLLQLARICSLLGVDLYWCSWSRSDIQSFEELRDMDSALKQTYAPIKEVDGNIFFGDSAEYPCHSDINTSKRFYIADDDNHWGAHYHSHVAEDFYNAIDLRDEI